MTPKISRLPRDEFRARGYKTTATPYFLLKTKNNSLDWTRVGTVVGKSVHKTAVKRNFWKRQAKEQLAVTASPGNDILIIFSPKVTKITKKQFKEELAKAIGKI